MDVHCHHHPSYHCGDHSGGGAQALEQEWCLAPWLLLSPYGMYKNVRVMAY